MGRISALLFWLLCGGSALAACPGTRTDCPSPTYNAVTAATLAGNASGVNVTSTGSTAARTLADRFAETVNVIDKGADPTGVADSAPAWRAAMGSNRRIIAPPGNYLFKSTQTAPCCAFGPPAVLVQSFSNFSIEAYGATIIVDPSIANSSAIMFANDSHFSTHGLTIQGNRTGLASSVENVGIALLSNVDFVLRDTHCSGNFGGTGTCFVGDWLVDGLIDHAEIDNSGICADFAYLKNFTYQNIRAHGADTTGAAGVGQKCFSLFTDSLNAATNSTGVSFTASDNVTVRGVNESNYAVGAAISTGSHLSFSGNTWQSNPGISGVPGLGVYVFYNASGSFASTGAPVTDLTISGDRILNNGAITTGSGIFIDSSAIVNSDIIGPITIANSSLIGNANTGISLVTATSFKGLTLSGNNFSGSAQTVQVNSPAALAAHSHFNDVAPTVSGCGASPPPLGPQSTDESGTITTGTGAPTLCTLNFGTGYATSPKCVVTAGSGTTPMATFVDARNGASIVMAFAAGLTSGTVDYVCRQ